MLSYLRRDADAIRAHVDPGIALPAEADSLFLIYAVLMRAKREQVTAADVHDAWAAWREISGTDSPSLVEYDQLEGAVRLEDEPFVRAIRAAAAERAGDRGG